MSRGYIRVAEKLSPVFHAWRNARENDRHVSSHVSAGAERREAACF